MQRTRAQFATIEEAIEDIRQGRMVVVVDDEDRENEGDLTIAAQFVTPDAINFMAKHGRGLICLALTPERCDEMGLDLMAAKNESPFETAFTVSIEARRGVTTGISAADRAHTIQVAIDPESSPRDVVQPGHVFPLKAKPGGVLERTGQTEAAVDLARLAGELSLGDSVAVNGVCLTATDVADGHFAADVMRETLRRSALAAIGDGSRVNLELPLRAADRLCGHVVQGHVDGVGAVEAVREDGFARVVTIGCEPALLRYVVEKGSIAVDGVSLTVARVDGASFDVSLIPETLERTSLGAAAPGAPVNLEVDIVAKYVEKLNRSAGGRTS